MKRTLFYLAVGLLGFSVTGCEKERIPPDDGNSQSSLLGAWHPTRKVSTWLFSGRVESSTDRELDETSFNDAQGLRFLSENHVAYMYYDRGSGRWRQSESEIEYFLSGDGTKIYVLTEDVKTYKIIQLTADEMVLLTRSPNNPYYPGSSYIEDQIYYKKSP